MATFTGTDQADTADAGAGILIGFTGGTMEELTDDAGDVFIGLAGNDLVHAGRGDDLLRGGLGADLLDGGLGSDTVDYSDNFGSVFVNLDIGRGFNNAAEGDTLSGIEGIVGTSYGDYIIAASNGDQGSRTQRSNGRQQTFFSDADYRAYRDLLRKHCAAHGVRVWSWVLMPNRTCA